MLIPRPTAESIIPPPNPQIAFNFFAILPKKLTFFEKVHFCDVYYKCGISFPTNSPMTWNLQDIGNALD